MRDSEAKYKAEVKMSLALEKMLADYKTGMEAEMQRLSEDSASLSGNSGKIRTQVAAQIENMRTQAHNHSTQQQQLIDQHKTNASIHEVTIASLKKEIEELEKVEG